MDSFLQNLISGCLLGCIYAMAALGFTIVFNATKIVNFANGEFLMLGSVGLAGAVATAGFPLWIGVALAIVCTAIVGIAMQVVVLNNARSTDELSLIMLTIGIGLALRGAGALIFGREVTFVPDFGLFPMVLIGDLYVVSQGVWIVVTLIVVGALLWYLFSQTTFGKAMKAASQEPRAAALCGIEPRRAAAAAFGIAAGLGGLSGALLAPISAAFYENGVFLGLKGFAAAVAGGMGNPIGAVLGGLIIGCVEALSAGYVSSGYKDGVAFMILLLMLLLRPAGILGGISVKRV
jgi:branched-chain amino acid transport system permease protein